MRSAAPRPATALALLLVFLVPIPTSAGSLSHLGWLCGSWGEEDTVVESWMAPSGGLMLGLNRAPAAPGERPFFEYLRIEQRDDAVVYVASPLGKGTTEFTQVEAGDGFVAFENPEHDFPQRISYRLEGDTLTSEISGGEGASRQSRSFHWRRLPCECDSSAVADGVPESLPSDDG